MEAANLRPSHFLAATTAPSPPPSPPPPSAPRSLHFLRHDSNTNSPKLKPPSTFSVRASAGVYNNPVVTLLDYGAGNVRSVRNAIRSLGFDIKDVQSPKDILIAERLIFPGVGAFAAAMDVLTQKGMAEALCTYIKNDRPFLGICLGLQLLFESSEENGPVNGLGLIPGVVGRFNSSNGLRVPHIGWNALQLTKNSEILNTIRNNHVYFVHSYRAMPSDDNKDWVSSTCNYGDNFIASVRRGNVHAVQFHPEKSGDAGLSVLRRFLYPKSFSTKVLEVGNASKLAKRVIACLDVRTNDEGDLVVTKGDQYDVRENTKENEVRNLGKPVDLAGKYYRDGADEISFLNITGFRDFPLGDLPMLQVLRYTSERVFVPLTVGGGIRDFTDGSGRYYSSLEVASEYFRSGADKVSIGSDAVYAAEEYIRSGVKTGKSSIEQISRVYGNQAVVVSIDPRRVFLKNPDDVDFKTVRVSNPGPNGEEYAWYQCTVNGGREDRQIGAYELAKAVEELGAGEIMLNCIDCDGQGKGFEIDLIRLISDAVNIPVIASSGAGKVEHFSEVFKKTNASAALAAGIFHREESGIGSVKKHLSNEGIEVRLTPYRPPPSRFSRPWN
ncbi:imidazole glycerol phosphate synthase hisHF, chloroplastic [Rhododendron vialii]|uniref:imidazole glycerol phosphate synthase hisHF, chloroplastic n=1 Tax=Rhododendron vialii TaxID=182163 RepID=UPI00265F550E|nr:imidazole glycerol phosphate synthase hisHF, chloroplastic [Rhododendron vialii]